ncbi:MAG: ribosome biogenesis GTPase Der [Pseudomonadota bacterium]
MKPVIALVGRPNVGKSTLFNRLTQTREALVADQPGLTRDRKYGSGKIGDRPYIVVDTGGLTGTEEGLEALVAEQTLLAVREADVVLFLVDGRDGLTPADEKIAAQLRPYGKKVFLVVNKMEGRDAALGGAEFYALGLGAPHAISSAHGQGVTQLMDAVLPALPASEEEEKEEEAHGIKIAVIGRPNVGKSTLVNRMLGEERVLAFDQPGTTRDSIYIPFERKRRRYTLIDTAGVRRRGKVTETIEKFSVIKTLQAVEDAHVVILVLDAQQGVTDQDAGLLGFVLESGRALVIVVNKWDSVDLEQRSRVKQELDRKLSFLNFAKIYFISALRGTRVAELFTALERAYAAANKKLSTPQLTRILEQAVAAHAPPLVAGRRIKLRYAHQGGHNPPLVVVHGNQTESVPDTYRRYLANSFREALKLEGTPVRVEFKSGANPYQGRKNVLTERQRAKRKRLIKHIKKK